MGRIRKKRCAYEIAANPLRSAAIFYSTGFCNKAKTFTYTPKLLTHTCTFWHVCVSMAVQLLDKPMPRCRSPPRLHFRFRNLTKMEDYKMSDIKKPNAYFSTMVRNSRKDDYRANDNFYKHISSVGSEADVQQHTVQNTTRVELDAYYIEQQLCETTAQNWLLFMEDKRLHKALCKLKPKDISFLFALSKYRYNCNEYAQISGFSKQAVSKRFRRLKKILKLFLEKGCPK